MSGPEGFRVVLVGTNDPILVSEGNAVAHSDQFDGVFIPCQRADEATVRLIETDLIRVSGRERNMGEESIYSAKYEDHHPEKDIDYSIEVEFSEYPKGTLQPYELNENNMRYVEIEGLDHFVDRLIE